MLESAFLIIMEIALIAIALRCFLSIPFSNLRMNWRGTKIRTGSISNLGFGVFFLHGSLVTYFVKEPIESFITVLVYVIAPASFALWLCFYGYKRDSAKYEIKSNT